MPVIGRSNHAFFFDGVSDSIVVPQGTMSRLGKQTSDGTKSKANILGERQDIEGEGYLSGLLNSQIAIEAWVIPDCGGVVVEKEDQFKLSVGEVDTPGPATFEVHLDTGNGKEFHFYPQQPRSLAEDTRALCTHPRSSAAYMTRITSTTAPTMMPRLSTQTKDPSCTS